MFPLARMARILMAKLTSTSVLPSRYARKRASSTTWGHSCPGDDHVSEDNLDEDEVESQLESILREAKKKEKATKFHKIRRKMNSPGAPERKLSWDAIQQIRYLKQESPQEWTLQKLAEGFSVSTDVLSRVLRSKFTPPPERRLKQDAKALAAVRQQFLTDGATAPPSKSQSRFPAPAGSAPDRITSGNMSRVPALISKALAPAAFQTGLDPAGAIVPSITKPAQVSAVTHNTLQEQPEGNQQLRHVELREEFDLEDDDEWDGAVLTDEELNELIHTLPEKPDPVEQKGRDFYDSDGNFLYRI